MIAIRCFIVALGLIQVLNASYPYTYQDAKGYSTTITKKPSRIVVAGGMWPLPSVIILLERSAKSLVYVPKPSKTTMMHSFMHEVFQEIEGLKSGESENIEELLLLDPDIFICHSANIKLCDAMKKSKIPTIEMSVNQWNYNSYETIKGWLDIIAPILDRQKEAQAFLNITKQKEQEIYAKASKESTKPRALIIHNADGRMFSVGGIFADYLLEKSGASNVIKSVSLSKITLEEIYRLNPEIIYLDNFNTLLPQDLLSSPLWQSLDAIKNKRVYKFPLASYRPFAPSLDLPILLEWLYEHNHPQHVKTNPKALLDFSTKFYKQYFNINLSKKQVEQIFTPVKQIP